MSEAAATSPVTIESYEGIDGASVKSVLGFDYACAGCDYNLRGLTIESRCPECREPVARSLSREYLQNANLRWVRSLRNGARLLAIGAILPLALVIVAIPAVAVFSFLGLAGMIFLGTLGVAAIVGLWLCYLLGWILLTRREPGTGGSASHEKHRSRCRSWSIIAAIVIPAVYVVSMVSLGFGMAQAAASGQSPALNIAVVIVLSLISPVVMITQFLYAVRHIGHLGGRLSSGALHTYAKVVFWVVVVTGVLGAAQGIMQYFSMQAMMANIQAASQTTTTSGTTTTTTFQSQPFGAISVMSILVGVISMLLNIALYGMYIGLCCWLWAKLSGAVRRRA